MQETQIREVIRKGLPKIASNAIVGIYPQGFQVHEEPPADGFPAAPLVGSQLLYTRNAQVYGFIAMEAAHAVRLGLGAFPKCARADLPKMVAGANLEVLNTIMAKVAYLLQKLDGGNAAVIAAPIALDGSKEAGPPVRGEDTACLSLVRDEAALRLTLTVQMV